mgnify:CR=1 FL=1
MDRLALVEARWHACCGDADKGWLIHEVKRLRRALEKTGRLSRYAPPSTVDTWWWELA